MRYEGGGLALHDAGFAILRGARICVSEPTNCGKSTLLDLLMGLPEPTSGAIRIDGYRLDDATRSSWQAQITRVPQSISLSDGSIAARSRSAFPRTGSI